MGNISALFLLSGNQIKFLYVSGNFLQQMYKYFLHIIVKSVLKIDLIITAELLRIFANYLANQDMSLLDQV